MAAGAAAALGGAWVYGAMSAESQWFGRVLVAGGDPGEVALTFDDGPNGDTTRRLLEILGRAEARATFFLIGRFARAEPEVVRSIASAGHLVGNHTMTHPWLHLQGRGKIREELGGGQGVLEDILGDRVRYFRPPHGARRPYVVEYARELGMETVNWNVMGKDWRGDSVAEVVGRVEGGVAKNRRGGRGSNVLLHDGFDGGLGARREETLGAVERLVVGFRGAGLRMVGVDGWGGVG